MFNSFQIFYNEKEDILEILKISKDNKKVCVAENGKYGIVMFYDIEENLQRIEIPEASVLFGIEPRYLINFANIL